MEDLPMDGHLPACDSEAARLLPWHVTGRLSPADAARVTQHLGECATCRADLDSQRQLRALLRDDGPLEFAPQAGLAATLARIDELEREVPAAAPAPGSPPGATNVVALPVARRASHTVRWLAAAAIVQAIGLGVLGSLLVQRNAATPATPAAYRTLSSPAVPVSGARLRAVFAPAMSVGELGTLLGSQGLQVLAGPTEAGVYTLGLAGDATAARTEAALRALRASAQVRFAEPAAQAGP